MKNILDKIHNFWFKAMSPERLALLRIATGLFSLWYLIDRYKMMMEVAKSSNDLFEPIGLVSFMTAPIPAEWFQILLLGGIFLNILYVLGFNFKITGPIFGVLLLFLMSYRNSWSMIYHNYNGLTLHIFIIGFTAAADALSWDAWRSRGHTNWLKKGLPQWQYGMPIVLICTSTVVTYMLSGLAKVWSELAWDWAQGTAMRSQVAADAIRKEMLGGAGEPLFGLLFQHTWIFMLMGIMTYILELGAFSALFHRKIAYVWAFFTLGMHWGIYFIMGIDFPYQLSGFIFLSFLPLENLLNFINRKAEDTPSDSSINDFTNTKSVVLFDGVCNFCNSTVMFIIDRDKSNTFSFTSIQSASGAALLAQYNAPTDLSTIVLIEKGKVYLRSTAVLRIARHLTLPYRLAYIFIFIPSVLRDFFYTQFAKRRYQWFGQEEACKIPSAAVRDKFLA